MLTLTWLTPHAGDIPAGNGRSRPLATTDLLGAKADADRVGIMRHGRLAHILTAAELRHTDLEKLYLATMAA